MDKPRKYDKDDWLPADVDRVLDAVLPMRTKAEFELMCTRLANQLGRSTTYGDWPGQPVYRMMWGLATRLKEYEPTPARRGVDIDRRSVTWAEAYLIGHAMNSKSEEAKTHREARPDDDYLADLLRLPIELVRREMQRRGPGRGRAGFGFI